MNQPLDLEHAVTGWLREEASSSGSDRVLAAAMTRVSTVGQERRWPTWMHMPMSPALKVAMVGSIALVFAVASVGILTRSPVVGPGLVVGSPSPSPGSGISSPGCPCPARGRRTRRHGRSPRRRPATRRGGSRNGIAPGAVLRDDG